MTITMMFYMLMPPPGTLGSPIFEGANITKFLERYKDLYSDYYMLASDGFYHGLSQYNVWGHAKR